MLRSRRNRRLRIRQFDPITETSEIPDHPGSPVLLGLFVDFWTSFLVMDSLVQNLPDQTAKPMSYYSDRLVVSQAGYIAAIEDLEDASFVLHRRVGRLIEDAPHLTVTPRGPVAAAHSRRLVIARAGPHPGREISLGGKRRSRATHFGKDLLRRTNPQTGYLRQPLYLVLMGAQQVGYHLVELANLLFD